VYINAHSVKAYMFAMYATTGIDRRILRARTRLASTASIA